ncbi:hypothetical protein FTX61_16465 [Nitriliruptoraceae bacterium ZYF776]|nr:hypothetical protein [Profundirhabdus halotolerans]
MSTQVEEAQPAGDGPVGRLGPVTRLVHRTGVVALAALGAGAAGLVVERYSGAPAAVRGAILAFLVVYFLVSVPLYDLTDDAFEPPLRAPTRRQLRTHARTLWGAVAGCAVVTGAALGELVPAALAAVVVPLATQVVVGHLVRIRRPVVAWRSWVPFARGSLLLLAAPVGLHTVARLWEPVALPWSAISTVLLVVVLLLLIGRVGEQALSLERHYRGGEGRTPAEPAEPAVVVP